MFFWRFSSFPLCLTKYQLYGILQHGIPQLKVASFSDFELIQKTRIEAEKLFPKIDEFPKLKEKIEDSNSKQISPD